jgi:hypothetical protein
MWKELCDIMYDLINSVDEFFEDYTKVFLKSYIQINFLNLQIGSKTKIKIFIYIQKNPWIKKIGHLYNKKMLKYK